MRLNFPSDEMRQELARDFVYSIRELPLQLNADEFTGRVGNRVYTEWCMGEAANKSTLEHCSYNGEAYERFLNDEILFYLERRAKQLGHATLCENHEEYLAARSKIVRAVVRRAAALLIKYNGETRGWTENLRASLEELIE